MKKTIELLKKNLVITIWIIIGVVLILVYWAFTWKGINWKTLDWQVLTGFATWILAGGIGIAIRQISETRNSTNAQLTIGLFEKFRRPEFKETLRDIIYFHTSEYLKNPTKSESIRIDELIDWFDMLGALVKKDVIDRELAIEVFAGPPALRCWHQLVLYIRKTQKERGFYCDYYEDFARSSLDHFNNSTQVILKLYWEKEIKLVETYKKLINEQKDEPCWEKSFIPGD